MRTLKSFLFIFLAVAGPVSAVTGCGASSPSTATTTSGVIGYAAGETSPVNGICPTGTSPASDGGCLTYTGAVGTTVPNCSLYTSANGCCPQNFTVSGGTCVATNNFSCQAGTAAGAYGCQPSTMPQGCAWSASYNGCVGTGTPQYTSYPGWNYQPMGSGQYVWYYTNNAPSAGYFWTGYGWAISPQQGYYWSPLYGWIYY